ncbi:S41 family peptidase [Leptospira biflexa]|uniref:S41 family peptidase n=1 Tax=Leptospira biflexa TaxID=172 RepID=UPI002279B674|nr:S41 family peptidase [Leptospira biflexa]
MDSINETIDLFISYGLLFKVNNANKDFTLFYAKEGKISELPLAIFVNHKTNSGAELIAGSLQYHKRAIVYGEKTFGNATIYLTHNFANNESYVMEIFNSLYNLPSGKTFQSVGIKPDIQISSEFDGGFSNSKKEDLFINHYPTLKDEEDKASHLPLKEIQDWVKEYGKANDEIKKRRKDPIRPDYFLFRAVDAFNGYLETQSK